MNVPTAVRTSLTTVAATLAVSAASLMATPALHAQLGIQVNVGYARTAPPPLPEMEQPEAPGDGYLWTPGYWAWDDQVQDYYWVEGEWVMAPETGMLWTPGYWNYDNGGYLWNAGYWGPEVGFYGGVNYGFGYSGTGYEGGYWNGNRFFYNTAVNRVNLRFVHNTFVRNVDFRGGNRVAFNGGPGGLRMQPNGDQQRAMQERRFAPTMTQQRGGFDRGGFDRGNAGRDMNRGGNNGFANAQGNAGFRGSDNRGTVQDFRGGNVPTNTQTNSGFRNDQGFRGGDNRGGNVQDNRGNDNRGNDNRGGNGFANNGQRPGNGFTPGDGQNRPAAPNMPRVDFPAMRGQVIAPQPPQRSFDNGGGQRQQNDNRGGAAPTMPQGGNRFQGGGGEQRQNFAPQGNSGMPQGNSGAPQGNRGGSAPPAGMRGFGRN